MSEPVTIVAPDPEEDPRVRRAELAISWLLRIGVIASLIITTLGVSICVVQTRHHTNQETALKDLIGEKAVFPHTPSQVIDSLRAGEGQAIIVIGLLVLLATPFLRVAISIFAFGYQGDRTFVIITILVLALLTLSLFIGGAH